jgi:hypothetical protein
MQAETDDLFFLLEKIKRRTHDVRQFRKKPAMKSMVCREREDKPDSRDD